ncbi:unnamed protein product [Caenorhabditis nigoni]
MLALFFVCFCLWNDVHAGVIATPSTTTGPEDTIITSDSFDEDAELKKIAESCFRDSNYEKLAGYTVRSFIARMLAVTLIPESLVAIDYYDLKEPRSQFRSLGNKYFYEHNVSTAIAYLDKRFPAIRKIYKRRFEKVRRSMELVDRKGIDRMLEEYDAVRQRVRDVSRILYRNENRIRCLESTD